MSLHVDEILDSDRHAAEGLGKIGGLRVGEGELEIVREVTADGRVARVDLRGEGGEDVGRGEVARSVGGTESGKGEGRGIHGGRGVVE